MDNYFKFNKIIKCEDTGEECKGYVNYLSSKHWITFRSKILKNIKYCSICNEKKSFYHLHHLKYDNLGKETEEDVLVLCNECHKLVHKGNVKANFVDNEYKQTAKKLNNNFNKCETCEYYSDIKVHHGKRQKYCKYKGILNPKGCN